MNSRHEFHVLTKVREDSNDNYSFPVYQTHLDGFKGWINFYKFLAKNASKYDIIYFSKPTTQPFELIARLFFKKIISHAHGTELMPSSYKYSKNRKFHRIRSLIHTCFFSLNLRIISKFIAVSDWTSNRLQELNVEEERIEIMHPGIEFSKFHNVNKNIDIEMPEDKLTLLTVGRLDERKGHDLVIESIKDIESIKYYIAGEGENEKELKSLVSELEVEEKVEFLGYVEDDLLPSLYHKCDTFILTGKDSSSNIEGFGIVFLEANAAGKPIIATNVHGIPSAVQNEETGILIEPKVDEIRGVIEEFKSEEYRNEKTTNTEEWAKKHDWSNIVKEIDSVISK